VSSLLRSLPGLPVVLLVACNASAGSAGTTYVNPNGGNGKGDDYTDNGSTGWDSGAGGGWDSGTSTYDASTADEDGGTADGGPVFVSRSCTDDADADDGVFCNGRERCGLDGMSVEGTPVTCNDGNECTTDSCSEEEHRCYHDALDADGDGHGDASCHGGDDCDDQDAARHPGAREICDDDIDNDCDHLRDCGDDDCVDASACAVDGFGGGDEHGDCSCDDRCDARGDCCPDCVPN
jgi:hypothetical protein